MRTKLITIALLSVAICLVFSGCGPGQFLGPTLTPTASPTATSSPTMTPTITPTATLTPPATLTPTATVTCTDQGWTKIDGEMLVFNADFRNTDKAILSTVNTTHFHIAGLALKTDIEVISNIEVAPCTISAKDKIIQGLNALSTYFDYLSKGAEKAGSGQILIQPEDISKDKTNAFHQEVKSDFVEAYNELLILKIHLDNFDYLVSYFNASYK